MSHNLVLRRCDGDCFGKRSRQIVAARPRPKRGEVQLNEWQQIVTFALALLGAVLGVINTWRNLNLDRLKLRVRFCDMDQTNLDGDWIKMYGFEVTNLSTFPVTISEVGLDIAGKKKERVVPIDQIMLDGGAPLPRRLNAREQLTVLSPQNAWDPGHSYKGVYATTVCGTTVRMRQRGLPSPPKNHT